MRLRPAQPVFDTTADALTALVNDQIDGVVQDLESATFITSEQFEGLGTRDALVAAWLAPPAELFVYG